MGFQWQQPKVILEIVLELESCCFSSVKKGKRGGSSGEKFHSVLCLVNQEERKEHQGAC